MRTDEEFVEKLEKLQIQINQLYLAMRSLNTQAERICVTLKAVTKETRLDLRLKTMQEQTFEAENLTRGTTTAMNNIKRANDEIIDLLG